MAKINKFEERLNRFMRMLLEWQHDIWYYNQRPNNYYFSKYGIGKYNGIYFKDISEKKIDRKYALNILDKIYQDRKEYDFNRLNK